MKYTATTINEVIIEIYNNKEIWSYLNYLNSEQKEDMIAELCLQLMENKNYTMDLYYSGVLIYYIFGTLKKMCYPKASFYRKYKLNLVEYTNDFDPEDESEQDNEKINKRLNNERFYDIAKENCFKLTDNRKKQFLLLTIFELYFEHKLSLRKIQKATGICYRNVWNYVGEIKENIKNHMNINKNE